MICNTRNKPGHPGSDFSGVSGLFTLQVICRSGFRQIVGAINLRVKFVSLTRNLLVVNRLEIVVSRKITFEFYLRKSANNKQMRIIKVGEFCKITSKLNNLKSSL